MGGGGWVIIPPTTGRDDSDEVSKDHIMDGRPCVSATFLNKVLVSLFQFELIPLPVLCYLGAEAGLRSLWLIDKENG